MMEDRITLYICIGIAILFALPATEMLLVSLIKKKERKRMLNQRPEAVLCHGTSYMFCMSQQIGIGLLVLGTGVVYGNLSEMDAVIAGTLFLLMGLALTIVFSMLIWNKIVIFDKDTIISRTILGKTKQYSGEEILGYKKSSRMHYSANSHTFSRRLQLSIKVIDGEIYVNNYMVNYHKAVDFVSKHYRHLE